MSCTYDPDLERFVVIWEDSRGAAYTLYEYNNSNNILYRVGPQANTNDAVFDAYDAADGVKRAVKCTYDTTNDRVIATYTQSASPYRIYVQAGAVSESGGSYTIAWGTQLELFSNTANNWGVIEPNLVHDPESGHTALFYSATTNNIQVTYISVSGTTITEENELIDSNTSAGESDDVGANRDLQVIYDSDNKMFHGIWRQENSSYQVRMGGIEPTYRGGADLSTKFIGIATATVADTATSTVQIMGVNENVSGLTAGSRYYVSGGGLTTTSSANIAGLALSATKLLIRPETA